MKNTFGKPIIPANDEARIKNLHTYKILDTPFEDSFDDIAQLTRAVFDVPIALIALVDKERVWFKANTGMKENREVSRGVSLCSLAILDEEVTVFENALAEPCLLNNPLVAGKFGLRFYAGAPLKTSEGFNIGTICIVDKIVRSLDAEGRINLSRIANIVMDKLEMRKSMLELSK